MQNEIKEDAPESMTPQAKERYELNFELVASTVRAVVEQLKSEGLGRSQFIEGDSGRERLRNVIWEHPGELTVLERCQVLEDVLRSFGKEQ